jgi:hypothetical protein
MVIDTFDATGYSIVSKQYAPAEIQNIITFFDAEAQQQSLTRLYAKRNVLGAMPQLQPLIFTDNVKKLIDSFGQGYFLTKSIYFNKPPQSNWFVPWHQDITIAVKEKIITEGFVNWTEKEGAFAVQPPVQILENIITLRIHLDDTNEGNGALHIIPQSHLNGIVRTENQNTETEVTCNVSEGGIMLMKPLLFHASRRTTNNRQRRVIHLEFSNMQLPNGLQWAEKLEVL